MKYNFSLNPVVAQDCSPSVDEEMASCDIRNQSVISYVFGFYNFDNNYKIMLVVFSAMAIIPIIGGMFSLMSCAAKGSVEFIYHPDVCRKRAFACVFLVFLRIILSCLGLGLLFFLLDLLYTLGCYIEGKIKGN